MSARLLYRKKQEYRSGIVEIVIWQLPNTDPERPHGLKYRLVYVKAGRRVVGYDNERSKGDHRHIGDREYRYTFQGVRQLVRDFWRDIKRCSDD